MNQAIDGHTDRSQLSAVGKETCDNVILRPLRCSRRPELVLRATASLFRKAVEAMLRRVDRRIILLALFFPAWSILAADLPKPDIVVAGDGTGDFKTVRDAVESIPATNRERVIVLIKDGIYQEKIRVDASFVTLRGQSRKGTRIEFSQVKDDFVAHPDELGWAIINLNHANDFVLENLTVENTANTTLAHAFTTCGTGDRTVIVDCDVLSHGGDTVSLGRGEPGRFYHARCNFSGAVDFVCPRGWCYVTDCNFMFTEKKRPSSGTRAGLTRT